MRMFLWGFIFFLTLCQKPYAIEIIGSDGPTPFSRIPAPRKVSIPLNGMVSSFSILEKTNKVAYVDPSRVLRVYDLNKVEELQFGGFLNQLNPVSDPEGKWVLSSDLRNIKRAVGKGSGLEFRLPVSVGFLGWEKNELYLLKKMDRVNSETWRISYFVYQHERNQVQHRECEFKLENSPKELKLGAGQAPPNLLLYSESTYEGVADLNLYELDLRVRNGQCQIVSLSPQPDLIKGNVTSVNWLPNEQGFVVISDHESANLYFGKSGSLSVANLPKGRSYLPNPKSPVVVNINRQKGIGVYSLVTGRYFTLELYVDRGLRVGNQVWVDSSGQQLYVSTRELRDKSGGRALHTVSLKGLN